MKRTRLGLGTALGALLLLPVLLSSAGTRPADDGDAGSQEAPTGWSIVAWNDLGMHCLDSDYGVFSVLPPYNTIHAQVVDAAGNLVTDTTGIQVTYRATADPTGSINTSSAGKTNFWKYVGDLYGATPPIDEGLLGNKMPGAANTPQPMSFDAANGLYTAIGIPLSPYDDAGHKRTYPLMRVEARDTLGQLIAETTPVLPVSDEVDCSTCHASGSVAAAEPAAGWVYDVSWERDYRLNLLRRHDEAQGANPLFQSALSQVGYESTGLYDTVVGAGRPVLCAACHGSNALPGTGVAGIQPFTQALHSSHASVIDPTNGMTLDSALNRSACYRCHPGSETRCLRGAMGAAVASDGSLAMQCQSCHGNMSSVGSSTRQGWLDEPSCQSCHTGTALSNNGQIRYTSVFETDGTMRVAVNATFATDPDAPLPGFSLFRESYGHGGLNCEACHGSTHAIFPGAHPNDNLVSMGQQGHEGTISECSSCHAGNLQTVNGGPHGMHPMGQAWVNDHGNAAEGGGVGQCRACHGTNYRGTELSLMQADRTLSVDGPSLALFRGARVSCYACHNGPFSENQTSNRRPVIENTSAFVLSSPVAMTLVGSDPDGDPLQWRVVQKPSFGRVAISGNQATYIPDPGFAGVDTFTFAAWDGSIDSREGVASVTRGASFSHYGPAYPGTGGLAPTLEPSDRPAIGTSIALHLDNTSGQQSLGVLAASFEAAHLDSPSGGVLLVEPDHVVVRPLPIAGRDFTLTLANDPSLIGTILQLQGFVYDQGAAFDYAYTQGLRLVFGQ